MVQSKRRNARIICGAIAIGAGLAAAAVMHSRVDDRPQLPRVFERYQDSSPGGHILAPRPALMPLSTEEAIAANAALPFALHAIEPAPAFQFTGSATSPAQNAAALDCLTHAIYYEAASESLKGQRAVAQVVLNRVRHPAFPNAICDVVYQGSERDTGCQFTFTCDGSLARKPDRRTWERAKAIASAALSGAVEPAVGMATHYHANWVLPYWAPRLDKLVAIDTHVFYRWKGLWGRRAAFSQGYWGEPGEAGLALASEEQAAIPLEPSVTASLSHLSGIAPDGRRLLAADLEDPGAPVRLKADQAGRVLLDESRGNLIADQSGKVLQADMALPLHR